MDSSGKCCPAPTTPKPLQWGQRTSWTTLWWVLFPSLIRTIFVYICLSFCLTFRPTYPGFGIMALTAQHLFFFPLCSFASILPWKPSMYCNAFVNVLTLGFILQPVASCHRQNRGSREALRWELKNLLLFARPPNSSLSSILARKNIWDHLKWLVSLLFSPPFCC